MEGLREENCWKFVSMDKLREQVPKDLWLANKVVGDSIDEEGGKDKQ